MKLPLTNGGFALIDDEDFDHLNQWKWYKDSNGYVQRWEMVDGKVRHFSLHRIIMNTPRGVDTDHANGNKLDNRKGNLRICSRTQNNANQKKLRGSSKYKGVCWYKETRKWKAQIAIKGRKIFLGYFISEIDAARTYNEAAVKYFGEFSKTNDI